MIKQNVNAAFLMVFLIIFNACEIVDKENDSVSSNSETDVCNLDDQINQAHPVNSTNMLSVSERDTVIADSLRCLYRQSYGSINSTHLQFQFLKNGGVAFALYIELDSFPVNDELLNIYPNKMNEFDFEVSHEGIWRYQIYAQNNISLKLNTLPSPTTLQSGDSIKLNGSIDICGLELGEISSLGEIGDESLEVKKQRIPITCTAEYKYAMVVN